MTYNYKARPFVKWAGGKRKILNEIKEYFPKKFKYYYEPFVGGGAIYFTLEEEIKHAVISDINCELITAYKVIKENPFGLIEKLKEHASCHSKAHYYLTRKRYSENLLDIAARFLYLNKTCYNGLYRVNKKGRFNVPLGDYKSPDIEQEENIIACHKRLQKTKILCSDFEKINPKKRDFVYFDPPYHPIDKTSFTKYTRADFSKNEQIRLAQFIKKLSQSGVYIMLSNSKTKFVESLYPKKDFKHHIVYAPRFVNCKSDERGKIKELIITNY